MHRWSKYSLTTENIGIYEEIFEGLHIIDCHTHIGLDADGYKLNTTGLLKKMKESGVDISIVFALNEPGTTKDFHHSNDKIGAACKQHKDKLIPFMRLNPHHPWKHEFKLRMEQGFKGVKLHPRSQNFKIGSRKAMDIYAACSDNQLPVLIHAGMGLENIADDVFKMCKTYPKLKVILGHAAFVDMDNVIKKVGHKENVLFDTSSLRLFDLYDLIKKLDHHKIAFGSDIPYYDVDWAMQGLIDTAIMLRKRAHQIRKIMGDNVRKWFR
ncbi:amidohydrolase family protein [Candidatus Woesearchaeota archaeon]|nr:amidohydrolase family protein [Candidatus Woesearchaeota archaeon]